MQYKVLFRDGAEDIESRRTVVAIGVASGDKRRSSATSFTLKPDSIPDSGGPRRSGALLRCPRAAALCALSSCRVAFMCYRIRGEVVGNQHGRG